MPVSVVCFDIVGNEMVVVSTVVSSSMRYTVSLVVSADIRDVAASTVE